MAVTSISVILTVCVLKLHHCGPHQKQVPGCIRWFVLKFLARVVNCQCHAPVNKKGRHWSNRKKVPRNSSNENAELCLRLVNECNMIKPSPVAEFRNKIHVNTTTMENNPDLRRLTVMEEILKYLKIMVAKRDDDDSEIEIVNEWRQVAQVIDRFLFWLFLMTTIVATMVMMVFIPLLISYQ